jgi:hypothetical protein
VSVEALEIPVHGDALAELVRLRDRLDARIAVAVGEYARTCALGQGREGR